MPTEQSEALRPFHLAFPVTDLAAAEDFYTKVLGCKTGRRSGSWIDFNFYGHQIVAHLDETMTATQKNQVDGEAVPVRHFGLILT